MTWWSYIQRHTTPGATQAEIAKAAKVDQTAVSRWERELATPAPATVIKVARAMGLEPVEALVEAGYLHPQEAGATVTHVEPADLTDDYLVDLLRDRLRKAGEHGGDTATTKAPPSPSGSGAR